MERPEQHPPFHPFFSFLSRTPPPVYKNLFFDLDDTLWAFSENARDAFMEVYETFQLGRYFRSFDHFYSLYSERNVQLWTQYGDGKITKEQLNRERFLHPLRQVGEDNPALAEAYSARFFQIIPTKAKLMPHAKEVLEYLSARYRLYILSNGFRELQSRKMQSAGIDSFFSRIVLSEDLLVNKPHAALFHFALSSTQSELKESLMIGDSWDADIVGAHGVGMHQVFYNVSGRTDFPFQPTYIIRDLKELTHFL